MFHWVARPEERRAWCAAMATPIPLVWACHPSLVWDVPPGWGKVRKDGDDG